MTMLDTLRLPWMTRQQQSWLAVDFNGFLLKAALIQFEGQEPSIIDLASASAASANESFEKVIAELRSRHPKLPDSGILTTTQAAMAMVDLPLAPEAEIKRSELQEAVRWEFEQQLCEQCGALTLETVLVGRELLEEEKVDEIRESLRQGNLPASSLQSNTAKFATKATELGLVKKADIEESLRLLAEFYYQEDEPCSRVAPLNRPEAQSSSRDYPWLVGGIGKNLRSQWVERFAAAGIRLERIYPLATSSGGRLVPDDKASVGLITLLDGLDCYAAYHGANLQTLRWGPAPLSARNPEALVNLIASDHLDRLWISGPHRLAEPVIDALKYALDIPVASLPNSETKNEITHLASAHSLDGILGAIRHLAKKTSLSLAWVEGADPAPPWWQQAAHWWKISAALVVLIILLCELSIAFRKHPVQWALREINEQIKAAQSEIAKVSSESQQADTLVKTVNDKSKAIELTKKMASILGEGLEARRVYSKAMFIALAKSVSPNVAVNKFTEDRDHFLQLEAWALTEKEAQEFVRSFADTLSPWKLSISHQQVRRRPGRLGLAGYSIELELKPNPIRSDQR